MLCFILFYLYFLLGITNGSQLLHLQRLLNANSVQKPRLDLSSSSNHELKLLGNFQDLSFYRYSGQDNFTGPLNSSKNTHGLIYYSNDTFLQLTNGSYDTNIKKIVPLGKDSFILSGSGHVEHYDLRRQLYYNLTDLSIKPIFQKALDDVSSILVDESLVYFGGNFTLSNGSEVGHSAALWNMEKNSTSLLPFIGFGKGSRINSMVKLDKDNILFAGKFHTLDDVKLLENHTLGSQNNSQKTNWSDVELGLAIPLQNSNWTYGTSEFDVNNFICPDSNKESWLQQGTSGSLSCNLPQDVTPYKIRIYNSPLEDNEISLFRIITNPSRGIMNLSYVDPEDGETKYCDAFCPLFNRQRLEKASTNSSSVKYMTTFFNDNTTDLKWDRDFQEFAFVNDVPIESVKFLALSSYGSNVGLSAWQLFQSSSSVYADGNLNKPACGKMKSYSDSSLSDNDWKQGLHGQTYLSTSYVEDQGDNPKVTFYPHIQYPGHYLIKLFTPGCLKDGTCNQRAIVNVTLWDNDSNQPLSTGLIYENNDAVKYNELWDGHLKKSPKVTLEYYAPIYPDNPSSVIVADYISVETKSIEKTKKHHKNITLNGLFQYQISNFTKDISKKSVGNRSLEIFPLSHFPKNSTLFASLLGNDTLLIVDSFSRAEKIKLGKNWTISSSEKFDIRGSINGIAAYSQGLFLLSGNGSFQERPVALSLNGSLNTFDKVNKSVGSFNNVTIGGSEILVFDNEFFYNTSSSSYFANNTKFGLSVWSAGKNSYGDLIFSGAVSINDYHDLQGPVSIFVNSTADSSKTNENISPYMGVYLNNTLTAYAYNDGSSSRLMFSDGKRGPWKWENPIQSIVYHNKDKMLAVGTSSAPFLPQVSVLNLTTSEILANETLNRGAQVNSIVLFGKNSTLLVGGNFTVSDVDCHGLCLYNYKNHSWSSFANNLINGQITQIQLHNSSELVIAGVFKVKNISNVNLVSLNIADQRTRILLKDWEKPLRSFVLNNNRLIAWDDTNLMAYANTSWKQISTSHFESVPKWQNIYQVSLENPHNKRADSSHSNLDALLVYGYASTEDNLYQASVYDFHNWLPFFTANPKKGESNPRPNVFMNRDDSNLFVSDQALPNWRKHNPSTFSSPKPSATATSSIGEKGHRHSNKVDRGYVVLIGLALSLGTVAVIGIIGVLVAFLFGEDIGGYEFLSPPAQGTKAVETTPPEKFSKIL